MSLILNATWLSRCAAGIGGCPSDFETYCVFVNNVLRGTPGAPLWQRNYYEHIVRNEASLNNIRQYI